MAIKKLKKNSYEIGSKVAVGGLAIQLVAFTFFIITCCVFTIHARHTPVMPRWLHLLLLLLLHQKPVIVARTTEAMALVLAAYHLGER